LLEHTGHGTEHARQLRKKHRREGVLFVQQTSRSPYFLSFSDCKFLLQTETARTLVSLKQFRRSYSQQFIGAVMPSQKSPPGEGGEGK